ncbi:precorrin-3B C(17)-methyltransferase [Parabacteroides sp. FAFU027]|uniref:precorrin-3B C(17)-methyltransferase n=1 Tax=Parabacteroides sp. FAFU027 TaxID=2922715 RepID=UPI001FAED275|nr:precorrin-3B C(17)-methyltransferase [Parabacteroides sp. FAFU027]
MQSKIFIIGTGPGSIEYMSQRAINAVKACNIVVGYKTYINLIQSLLDDKTVVSSGMRKEVDRCGEVINLAKQGNVVGLISSGDAGVYGMAGILLEMLAQSGDDIDVEVVPGITSALSSASLAGAPLMNDFAVISLSDLMTPWEVITHRIDKAAEGDFVISLYNPKSKERVEQIGIFREIVLRHRKPETPVVIVRDAMREEQQVTITTLGEMLTHHIDMTTTLIVGNSQTFVHNGRMITPRGYKI